MTTIASELPSHAPSAATDPEFPALRRPDFDRAHFLLVLVLIAVFTGDRTTLSNWWISHTVVSVTLCVTTALRLWNVGLNRAPALLFLIPAVLPFAGSALVERLSPALSPILGNLVAGGEVWDASTGKTLLLTLVVIIIAYALLTTWVITRCLVYPPDYLSTRRIGVVGWVIAVLILGTVGTALVQFGMLAAELLS